MSNYQHKRLAVLMQGDCLQLCKLVAVHKNMSMSELANTALRAFIKDKLLNDDELYKLVSNMKTTEGSAAHAGLALVEDLRRNR